MQEEFTVHDNFVANEILNRVHEGHQGIVKCREVRDRQFSGLV